MAAALLEVERRVEVERQNASAEIWAKLKPEHDAIIADVCGAIVKLHDVSAKYSSFVDRVSAASVEWPRSVRKMHLAEYGIGKSLLFRFLETSARSGYIDATVLPEELRRGMI
jgi:ATPase subunit of ABC transporter with duplicated ATPase domains